MRNRRTTRIWAVALATLLALSLGGFSRDAFLSAAPKKPALSNPALRLMAHAPLGSTQQQILQGRVRVSKEFSRENRFYFGMTPYFHGRSVAWNEPQGMAKGMLRRPHLLRLLNDAGVEHPFFSKLPESGPTFQQLGIEHGPYGVFALVDGKTWAVAMAIPIRLNFNLKKSDPRRVDEFTMTFRDLGVLCSELKVTEKDRYGNPITFAGEGCAGGRLFARFDPTTFYALSVLIYPKAAKIKGAK
jgi:hypothetical protein